MFTVLLLSESAKEILNGSRDYFKPFEESGMVAFCDWVQSENAATLYEVVPDLTNVIRGKDQWRAVVVDHARGATVQQQRSKENPFDFLDNTSTKLSLEPSKHRLVRLAHVLLGYPHLPAKDFEAHYVYKDEDGVEQDIVLSTPEGGLAKAQEGAVPEEVAMLPNVRRKFTEVPHSHEDKTRHAELVELYQMKEVHPSEVVFIVTSDSVEADEEAGLQRAWRDLEQETVSDRFVERNDYPPKSRFATYELLEKENSGYERDLQTFWLAVLTLSINQLPTSSFQAERLYRLDLAVSKDGMARMLNEHISTLVTVRDNLEYRIRGIRKAYSMDVRDLLSPIEVSVPFADVGGAELEVSGQSAGLATDIPRNEAHWWFDETRDLEANAEVFMRKPRRALARSVQDTRAKARLPEKSERVLDQIEIDELSEQLDTRLEQLMVPTTAGILDRNRFRKVIERHTQAVRSYISQRANSTAIIASVGISLLVWLMVLAPYLFIASKTGGLALKDATIATLLVVLALGLATLGALYLMRRKLIRMIETMNTAMLAEVIQVHEGGDKFAAYLGDVATYARGREVLRGTERALEKERNQVRTYQALRRRIVDTIAQEKEVVQASGTGLAVKPDAAFLAHFDPSNERDVDNLFRYPVTPRLVPFGTTGEYIEAPYDFIEKMSLEHVSLLERPADQAGLESDQDRYEGDRGQSEPEAS